MKITIRMQEKTPILSNKWLLLALAVSVLMQFAILYTPLNVFFGIVPLGFVEWSIIVIGLVIGFALAILVSKLAVILTPASSF